MAGISLIWESFFQRLEKISIRTLTPLVGRYFLLNWEAPIENLSRMQ
jgi:hypothetical protein